MSTHDTVALDQAGVAAERTSPDERTGTQYAPTGSRRRLLRLAGAMAAGGVAAAVLGAEQAAAVDGITITAGAATSTANFTQVSYTGASTNGHQFLFRGPSTSMTAASTQLNSVLGGVSNGLAASVLAYNEGAGPGLRCQSLTGVAMTVTGWQHQAAAFNTNSGATNPTISVAHDSGGNQFVLLGGSAPYSRAFASQQGSIAAENGNVWWCVTAGTPGQWRKLAGPASAGAFHAIATARVYDSRKDMTPMTNGTLGTGASRLISVADKRDPTSGSVTTADVVPDKASAVAYNLTAVGTVGTNGFLAVEPGDAPTFGGSTINWSAAGITIANASTAKLDATRQLKVFCGGTSTSCHFIIDIVGYYL